MSERKATQDTEATNQEEIPEPLLEVRDLEATDTEEVKGGPKKIFIGGIS